MFLRGGKLVIKILKIILNDGGPVPKKHVTAGLAECKPFFFSKKIQIILVYTD